MAEPNRRAFRAAGMLTASLLGISAFVGTSDAQQLGDYKLHAGDQIEISVWKEMDLQRTLIIRPDGRFSFPLTGEIVAAGRPAADIQTEIGDKLKKYIPEPVVTVSVTGIEGNRIYVIGQVNKPGAIVMNPQFSVLQALSIAGGMTPFAALNDITIIRGSGSAQKVLPFRYTEVSRGKSLEANLQLESGDVIIVP